MAPPEHLTRATEKLVHRSSDLHRAMAQEMMSQRFLSATQLMQSFKAIRSVFSAETGERNPSKRHRSGQHTAQRKRKKTESRSSTTANSADSSGEEGVSGDLESDLLRCIAAVNKNFALVKMEWRKMTHEHTHEEFWSLCNTETDLSSQLATQLSPWQLVFFKKCLKLIVGRSDSSPGLESTPGTADEADIVDLRRSPEVMKAREQKSSPKLREVQDLVQMLTRNGWLSESKKRDNSYTVGVRTLLELSGLLEEYDCRECVFCSYLVVDPYVCSNENCTSVLHAKCARDIASHNAAQGKQNACPTCSTEWPAVIE